MNNMYQFQDILRIFTRVRAWTDRQTNQMDKRFSALLEGVKNEKLYNCTLFPENYI